MPPFVSSNVIKRIGDETSGSGAPKMEDVGRAIWNLGWCNFLLNGELKIHARIYQITGINRSEMSIGIWCCGCWRSWTCGCYQCRYLTDLSNDMTSDGNNHTTFFNQGYCSEMLESITINACEMIVIHDDIQYLSYVPTNPWVLIVVKKRPHVDPWTKRRLLDGGMVVPGLPALKPLWTSLACQVGFFLSKDLLLSNFPKGSKKNWV